MIKEMGLGTIIALFLLLGVTASTVVLQNSQESAQKKEQPAKAQQQQERGKQHGQQQQGQAKPHNQQEHQQANTHQNQGQQRQQANTHQNQPEQRQAKSYQDRQGRQQQVAWQNDRATNWQTQHRSWQQRGGYDGYRIPASRYNRYYGQNHVFRINTLSVMYVGSNPRFQYGGYWFGLVDPWPQYWSNNWYDNDDMYIVYYGGGYYLCNRSYPRDRIAITIYMN